MALFLRKNMPVIAGLSGASLAVILMLLYHYTRDKIPEACFVLGAVVVMLFSVLGFLLGKNFVQLQKAAMLDDLTQLWNKKYFNIRLEEELERMKRKGTPLCLAYIDIDDFKRINDKYGHVAGDKYLNHLGEALTKFAQNFRIHFYRYGGEEFVAMAYGYDEKELLSIAESLRISVQSTDIDGHRITTSIGVAYCGDEQVRNYENIIDRADKANYAAKRAGRNKVCMEQKEMQVK